MLWLQGLALRVSNGTHRHTMQLGGVVGILLSQEKKKKYEPPAPPPRVGKKQKKRDTAASLGAKLPTVTPTAKCKLRLLKLERIKDYLLMEEEFVQNQEQLKPQEERNEEDRSKVGQRAQWGPGRASRGSVREEATGDHAAWPPEHATLKGRLLYPQGSWCMYAIIPVRARDCFPKSLSLSCHVCFLLVRPLRWTTSVGLPSAWAPWRRSLTRSERRGRGVEPWCGDAHKLSRRTAAVWRQQQ